MKLPSTFEPLRTEEDRHSLLRQSRDTVVMLFKHSATCPVSQRISERIISFLADNEYPLQSWILVVQEARNLSDTIALHFGIQHETPQVIIVHNEQPVWTASHGKITADVLRQVVEQLYTPANTSEDAGTAA